jgi:hypothetical protein
MLLSKTPVNCLLPTAYCPTLLFVSAPARGAQRLALSTLYRGHRRYCPLFVTGDDYQVALLNRT